MFVLLLRKRIWILCSLLNTQQEKPITVLIMAPNYSLKPLTQPLTLHQPHMPWTVSKITHIAASLIYRTLRVLQPHTLLNVTDLWPAARLPSCSHSSGILMCHQPSSSWLSTPTWLSHKWPSLLRYVLSRLVFLLLIIIIIANRQRKGSIMSLLLTIAVTKLWCKQHNEKT